MPASPVQTTNKVSPDPCWWCGVPADSREHKFKRSDLIREHGQAPYVGGATLSGVGASGSVSMRSSKNDTLRFAMTMCQRCNNERSQPFDNAYDQFIEWILAHEETVVDARSVDLDDVFGASWQQEARNLLCYFVKHMCCRLAEIKTPDVPATIPPDVIAFLDGGPNPASLMCEFSIEPALLHWRDMRPGDPLWTPRPLWLDELFLTGSAPELQFIQSRWRYSWLSLAWAVGLGANGSHPFAHQSVPIPIVAGSWSPLFELVLADGRYRDATGSMGAEDGIDPAVLTSRATRMRSLWDSPVVLAFVASALDFEAAMRGRAPDARRNTPSMPTCRCLWRASCDALRS